LHWSSQLNVPPPDAVVPVAAVDVVVPSVSEEQPTAHDKVAHQTAVTIVLIMGTLFPWFPASGEF